MKKRIRDHLVRTLLLAGAGTILAACVVAPQPRYYRPAPAYYAYPAPAYGYPPGYYAPAPRNTFVFSYSDGGPDRYKRPRHGYYYD